MSFDAVDESESFINRTELTIRPSLSVPSSPMTKGVTTPGDFATLQDGMGGLGLTDYFTGPHDAEDNVDADIDGLPVEPSQAASVVSLASSTDQSDEKET